MKKCNKCEELKPIDQFFKAGGGRSGYRGTCKACYAIERKSYRERNSESIKEYRAEYLSKNRDRYLASCRDYREKNRKECSDRCMASRKKKADYYREAQARYRSENIEKCKEAAKDWWGKNKGKRLAYKSARRAAEVMSIPAWADMHEIAGIYRKASEMDGMHVDHIVPLISPVVCGLHVSNNLQIITAKENMSKGNRYWPDMP